MTTAAVDLATGLRALADLLESAPADLAEDIAWIFSRLNNPVYTREVVAAWARLGVAAGAKVTKHQDENYAGVDVAFGPVSVHVYADRAVVCERVVTGTREVTEEVPDPDLLAAVPRVSVTRTEEIVSWECKPLLAESTVDVA